MATKAATAVYAPGEDPESARVNFEYQEALKKLTESIDQRKNRFFDPVWLAAAKGFLAPGSINTFESLGRVAGNIGAAQEAEAKEERDIAQMRLELAGRGVELQRQKSRDAMARRFLAGEGEFADAAPQTPAGALPAATAGESAAGARPAQGALARAAAPGRQMGIQIAPRVPGVNRQQFAAMGLLEGKSPSDIAKEWETIQRGRQQTKEGFMLDTSTGMAYTLPTGKFEDVPVHLRDGTVKTFKLPANISAELSDLARRGMAEEYYELSEAYIKGFQREPAGAAPAVAPAVPGAPAAARPTTPATGAPRAGAPTGMLSVDEAEARKAREKALQEAETQMEVESRKDFNQRSRDAGDSITMANMLRRFSEDPNASKMVGILSNEKVSSALATLVKEGVGSRDYRVGVPAIEKVMRNADMGPEDQAKFRVLLMNIAQMRLQLSKYMKGSVSNFEQELMGDASVTTEDTPQAIQMKADLLTRRAQFDRQANRAFKDSRMTADEFLESEQYQRMRDKYDEDLAAIAMGERRFQMGRRPDATSAAPAAPAAPAAASTSRPRTPPQSPDPRLTWDQTLNNGAGGWRRKKQGE
jgi:hypothetical protein